MSATLADLLNVRSFRLTCASGHRHLHRRVNWVHVAEVNDPSPWLTHGVMLLTTGLAERSTTELDAFFASLAEKRVAAVGFGVGITHEEIPAEWLHAADAHEVPILRVPLATPYIAISEFVSRRNAEAQMGQVKRMLDTQHRLARSRPSPEDQLEHLRVLGRELGATVLLRSSEGIERCSEEGPDLSASELDALSREMSRHAESGRRSSSISIGGLFAHIAATAAKPIAIVRHSRYSPVEQSIIGSIAMFIDLDRRTDGDDEPPSLRERLVAEAISGDLDAAPRLFELVLAGVERCSVVLLAPADVRPEHPAVTESAARSLAVSLASRGDQAGTEPPLVCSGREGVYAILPDDAIAARETAESWLRLDGDRIGSWHAGVSRAGQPGELLDMCEEAGHALRAAVQQRVPVLDYASLPTRDLLRAWSAEAQGNPLFAEWSRRLDMLGRSAADRLIGALHAFLHQNGAVERAAAELGVHRQTLHARLAEAERRLAVSLSSPTDRALLWLALETDALGGGEKGARATAARAPSPG